LKVLFIAMAVPEAPLEKKEGSVRGDVNVSEEEKTQEGDTDIELASSEHEPKASAPPEDLIDEPKMKEEEKMDEDGEEKEEDYADVLQLMHLPPSRRLLLHPHYTTFKAILRRVLLHLLRPEK
jgi:hypothetical protein